MGSCCSYEKEEDYNKPQPPKLRSPSPLETNYFGDDEYKNENYELSASRVKFVDGDDHYVCYKYKVRIVESQMESIRGGGYVITEFFVPDKNIYFNKQSAFKAHKPRNDHDEKIYPLIQVKIPVNIINKISDIADLQTEINIKNKKAREMMMAMNLTKEYHDLFMEQKD